MIWAIFTIAVISFGYYVYLFYDGFRYLTIRGIDDSMIDLSEAKVTVIIPFRDATEELLIWLSAFEKVKYASLAEVLLINDGSINSLTKLRKRIVQHPNVRLIDRHHQGKKRAIEYGVSMASSHLIVCTDADTIPHANWLAGILLCFKDRHIQMVCGRVAPKGGFWLAQIDFMALMAAGEVLIKKQKPVMCSGSHMAFRKTAFEAVEGYNRYHHFRSGDDVLLLHKMKSFYGSRAVAFNDYESSHVSTDMPNTFGRLLIQRRRWGGKTLYYRDGLSVALAAVVLVCAVLTYPLFLMAWPDPLLFGFASVVVGSKIFIDVSLIRTYAKILDASLSLRELALAVMIYPFYIGFIFLLILVNPNPRWS